jgi:hypothetical protein
MCSTILPFWLELIEGQESLEGFASRLGLERYAETEWLPFPPTYLSDIGCGRNDVPLRKQLPLETDRLRVSNAHRTAQSLGCAEAGTHVLTEATIVHVAVDLSGRDVFERNRGMGTTRDSTGRRMCKLPEPKTVFIFSRPSSTFPTQGMRRRNSRDPSTRIVGSLWSPTGWRTSWNVCFSDFERSQVWRSSEQPAPGLPPTIIGLPAICFQRKRRSSPRCSSNTTSGSTRMTNCFRCLMTALSVRRLTDSRSSRFMGFCSRVINRRHESTNRDRASIARNHAEDQG